MAGKQGILIDSMTANNVVELGGVLVDVRSAEEHAVNGVKRSVNIPYDIIAMGIEKVLPSKARQIVLYSNAGVRSTKAAQKLAEMGYACVCKLPDLVEAAEISHYQTRKCG